MSAIYFKTQMKEMPKNCAECESRMYCHLPRGIGTTEGKPEYREKRHKREQRDRCIYVIAALIYAWLGLCVGFCGALAYFMWALGVI